MSYSGKKGWITKPKPGVRIDPLHPLSRGLIGCWLLNEGAGSVVYDISGFGNHGILTNMYPEDWVGSLHGGGLKFEPGALSDYIDVPSPIDPSGLFSLSMWFFSWGDYVADGDYCLVALGHANNMFYLNDVDPGLAVYDGTGVEVLDPSTSLLQWHHVAITHHGDGVVDGLINDLPLTPAAATTFLTTTANWEIGRRLGGTKDAKCYVDGISIWDRELTTEEKRQLCHDPYCSLLRVPIRRHFVAPVVVGQPMNLRGTTVPHLRQWHPRIA